MRKNAVIEEGENKRMDESAMSGTCATKKVLGTVPKATNEKIEAVFETNKKDWEEFHKRIIRTESSQEAE